MNQEVKNKKSEELIGKEVAFYETFLSAWVENRMEIDKQVLNLSALAIGLLFFFHNKLDNLLHLFLWCLANISFISSIILILHIFHLNSDYIEKILKDDEKERIDLEKNLNKKTQWSFKVFIFGIIVAFMLVLFKTDFVVIIKKMV
jgi:hypothetical protein